MTDRELLEKAAKAAGLVDPKPAMGCGIVHAGGKYWNPLTDDGDALRLAVKLGLTVVPNYYAANESLGVIEFTEVEDSADFCAPTRRAILRAAAAMGEA